MATKHFSSGVSHILSPILSFLPTNKPTHTSQHPPQIAAIQADIQSILTAKRKLQLTDAVAASAVTPPLIRNNVKLRRQLRGHYGKVTAVHWNSDSLVSAGQDGNLLVWNPISSQKSKNIRLKSAYVMSVGMEASGSLVACGGLDNLCTVYNTSDDRSAVELGGHAGFLSCCRFIEPNRLVTASGDSTCILWDIPAAKPISTFKEHTADVVFLSLRDNNTFVSCSVDKTCKLWDMRTAKNSQKTFLGHLGDVNGVDFLPTDKNCFATCSQDNTARLFDLRAYNEIACFGTAVDPEMSAIPDAGFTSLVCSKSGRLLFCGHSDGSAVAFDSLKGTIAFTLNQAHDQHISCVGVSPGGEAFCTGSWDNLVKIWA